MSFLGSLRLGNLKIWATRLKTFTADRLHKCCQNANVAEEASISFLISSKFLLKSKFYTYRTEALKSYWLEGLHLCHLFPFSSIYGYMPHIICIWYIFDWKDYICHLFQFSSIYGYMPCITYVYIYVYMIYINNFHPF